jgi:SPP1 gp7 family putative phage head morphogenesis protein
MAQVADVEVAQEKKALQEGATLAYNHTMYGVQKTVGMMFQTEGMSTRRAAEILRQNWSGKLYSARVWNNCNEVAEQVATLMTEMVMSGKASRQSMDELVGQAIDNGRMAANRLLRTEYNHVAGQAELEAYTDAKVTHYRYIAVLDGRTSQVCRDLDGKVFPIAERKVGKNMHPMHPWCRSSTAPVINGVVLKSQKRIARDLKTGKIEYIPATMTYNEWIKSKTQ